MELKLREREPKDLDEALSMAVRLEAYASAYESGGAYGLAKRVDYERNDARVAQRVSEVEPAIQEMRVESLKTPAMNVAGGSDMTSYSSNLTECEYSRIKIKRKQEQRDQKTETGSSTRLVTWYGRENL